MSSHERVPNELWLAIFELLPCESVKQLFSSDRRFSTISRGLLFSQLALKHIRPDENLPSAKYIQFTLDRLDFWSSDEIAPLVRHCTITPWTARWRETGPDVARLESDRAEPSSCTPLLAAFIERLGRFTNLQMLYARHVVFSQPTLAALCRLPCLDNVTMDQCGVGGEYIDTEGLHLRTSRFVYRDEWRGSGTGLQLWVPLLHPDHLRELKISGFPVFATMPPGPPFPNVYKLTARLCCLTASEVLAALSRFPAVRVLDFESFTGSSLGEASDASEATRVLPLLEKFKGDYQLLPLLPGRPTLKHLVIDNCAPTELAKALHGMASGDHIVSLHATLDSTLREMAFKTVCRSLPNLVDLHIEIQTEITEGEYEGRYIHRATDFFFTLADTAFRADPWKPIRVLTWRPHLVHTPPPLCAPLVHAVARTRRTHF
ncbi:hypothetical protein FB45DRAFT_1116524 [Roridomyces roridus]|uniref:F-box domain-containing protein n=1 Tax=Roridomyces roridus TaxID=1738132 RepID=A0AAD7FV60_9AGAR|nr:hypothetical protein FB45DRAFT_1116524 [Roridomyces roridus]